MAETAVLTGAEQGRRFAALYPAAPQDGLVQVLAPMVRVSNLPMRLLALQQGATVVYSEELIAKKLANSERVENPRLGTVEFYERGRRHFRLFQTCAAERGRVILQLGVATPEDAVAAARVVGGDVAGIDVNMGCPKSFSVNNGFGAALLAKPRDAAALVAALKAATALPVTAKIRLLESPEDTISFMRALEAAGVDAIAVHCRHVPQRSRTAALRDALAPLVGAVAVPVLGNGDVDSRADALAWQARSGCAGLMVARGACENPSCFARAEDAAPCADMLRAHARLCCEFEEVYQNIKYLYSRFFSAVMVPGTAPYLAVQAARSRREVCAALDAYAGGAPGGASALSGAGAPALPPGAGGLAEWFDALVARRGAAGAMEEAGWGKGDPQHFEYGETLGVKRAREAAGAGAGAGAVHKCATCGEAFASRNALFRHFRASDCDKPPAQTPAATA